MTQYKFSRCLEQSKILRKESRKPLHNSAYNLWHYFPTFGMYSLNQDYIEIKDLSSKTTTNYMHKMLPAIGKKNKLMRIIVTKGIILMIWQIKNS